MLRGFCLKGAHSTEMIKDTPHPVVVLQDNQKAIKEKGGTMRLGSYPVTIQENSLLYQLYNKNQIHERHRHRYEINPEYFDQLQSSGELNFSGFFDNIFAECLELKNHPYFVGVQYHPEFKSSPWKPTPPYLGLIESAINRVETRNK